MDDWSQSSCSCPVFIREYCCKHVIGIGMKKQKYSIQIQQRYWLNLQGVGLRNHEISVAPSKHNLKQQVYRDLLIVKIKQGEHLNMNHKEKEKEAAQRKCQLLALPNVLMKIMMKQIRTYPLHQHQPKLANEKNKPVRSMRIIARPWRNDFDLLLKILHLIVYNCKMTGFL